jgi:hypothetical protein
LSLACKDESDKLVPSPGHILESSDLTVLASALSPDRISLLRTLS